MSLGFFSQHADCACSGAVVLSDFVWPLNSGADLASGHTASDTKEESWPTPRSPTRPCSTNWPPRQQRCEVAAALRNVAETFAGVPDGRDTAYTFQMLAYMLDSG